MGRRFESSRARGGGWVAAQSVLLIAIALSWLTGRDWGGTWTDASGWALMGLGVALGAWCAVVLGSALTPFPAPLPGSRLATRGPYAWVRHPMYDGVLLLALGASLRLGTWLGVGLTCALFVVFDLKSRREEAWLLARPGYAEYRTRVRGRLVPFVY